MEFDGVTLRQRMSDLLPRIALSSAIDRCEMPDRKVIIEFEQTDANYGPGDNVIGTVLIRLQQATKCKALSIKIEGICSVLWVEEKKRKNIYGRKEKYLQNYSSVETYFERTFYLIRSTDNEDLRQLPAGESHFPFNVTLPQNIPCTFEHKFGTIMYFITATFTDNNSSLNLFDKVRLKVITPYNLNQISRAAVGIDDEAYRNFSCMCFIKMGSLHARIKTPIGGFIPGQTIEVAVSFYNDSSSVDVTKIKVALEQVLKFQATRPNNKIKSERAIIGKDKKHGSFGDKNEVNLFIKVPQVLPSNLIHCSLIEIQYRLKVKILTSGTHSNIKRSYPILIGTIPLYTTSATVVPLIRVQHNPTIVPSAPTMDAVVPVPQANINLNHSSTSQQETTVVSQSFSLVHQEEYQPIGFVFTNHLSHSQSTSRQPETPPPSYEECTSNT